MIRKDVVSIRRSIGSIYGWLSTTHLPWRVSLIPIRLQCHEEETWWRRERWDVLTAAIAAQLPSVLHRNPFTRQSYLEILSLLLLSMAEEVYHNIVSGTVHAAAPVTASPTILALLLSPLLAPLMMLHLAHVMTLHLTLSTTPIRQTERLRKQPMTRRSVVSICPSLWLSHIWSSFRPLSWRIHYVCQWLRCYGPRAWQTR